MNTDTIMKLEQKHQISRHTFEKLYTMLDSVFSFSFSTRYNAKYGLKDMTNALVSMCIEKSYAESGLRRLAIESDLKKVPSGSWLLNSLKKIPEPQMMQQLTDAMNDTIKIMKKMGMFSTPITVAIDKHLISRYDKNIDEFLIQSKGKNGTGNFEGYCTMSSVTESCRVCLGALHVTSDESNFLFVRKLINNCIENRIRMRLILLDREFFSINIIHELKQLGQTFLMPARKTAGIKNAIKEHARGERNRISRYKIRDSSGDGESFTLIILPNPKPEKPNITDQYVVFATNITKGNIPYHITRIPEEYKSRWGIETGYACVEKLRPRTTSPNHSVRLMMFYFSLIFYNTWVITNCLIRGKSNKNYKPAISIEILKCFFKLFVIEIIKNQKRDYFLDYVG